MADSNIKYNHFDYDDLLEGEQIKLDHSVYYDVNNTDNDISDLILMPLEKVEALREKNIVKEKAVFEKVRQAAFAWEKQAVVTARFDSALEYLRTPETEHSSNTWIDEDYGYKSISNMVYKMRYKIEDDYSWRNRKYRQKVTWSVFLNTPNTGFNIRVAGNEKICQTKEEAEKYINGRIKAFSHLFTEISPPVPDIYAHCFCVSGKLLQGYITETMRSVKETAQTEKPSVRKQLDTLKNQQKNKSSLQRVKDKSQHEIV